MVFFLFIFHLLPLMQSILASNMLHVIILEPFWNYDLQGLTIDIQVLQDVFFVSWIITKTVIPFSVCQLDFLSFRTPHYYVDISYTISLNSHLLSYSKFCNVLAPNGYFTLIHGLFSIDMTFVDRITIVTAGKE